MKRLDSRKCTRMGPTVYWTDAEDQGISPGDFPEYILTNLGNGGHLALSRRTEETRVYKQCGSEVEVTIFFKAQPGTPRSPRSRD